jgi:transcription-repair coupling factor (superfamily II helicase)
MTKTITIELSDTQEKSMEYVTSSSQDWATNSVTNRARQAADEIVKIYTNRALDEGINIPVTRDEIVVDAFAREWVKTAEQVAKEFDEELAKK